MKPIIKLVFRIGLSLFGICSLVVMLTNYLMEFTLDDIYNVILSIGVLAGLCSVLDRNYWEEYLVWEKSDKK